MSHLYYWYLGQFEKHILSWEKEILTTYNMYINFVKGILVTHSCPPPLMSSSSLCWRISCRILVEASQFFVWFIYVAMMRVNENEMIIEIRYTELHVHVSNCCLKQAYFLHDQLLVLIINNKFSALKNRWSNSIAQCMFFWPCRSCETIIKTWC